MDTKANVGVIGLGIMGKAMAQNLMKAGYHVSVFNRTASKAKEFEGAGATACRTPKELADRSDVIVVMVTGPGEVAAILSGGDGVLASAGRGKVLIQMSTIDVQSTKSFAEQAASHHFEYLDSPVTGSKKQVEAAELIIEVGGAESTLEKVRPVLLAMGKHIVHAGPVGNGSALKLCMNMVVAQMTTAVCESVAFAEALGVDPAHIFEVIEESPALDCGYFKIKKEPLLSREYPPAFSLANMLKDVRFMNKEAAARALALPVTKAVQALMEETIARHPGDQDLTVLLEQLRAR